MAEKEKLDADYRAFTDEVERLAHDEIERVKAALNALKTQASNVG